MRSPLNAKIESGSNMILTNTDMNCLIKSMILLLKILDIICEIGIKTSIMEPIAIMLDISLKVQANHASMLELN